MEQKELKVLNLINNNKDNWQHILSNEPYNIIIKEKYPYYLLKYNQLDSDMLNEIVQECRGLIIKDNGDYEVASMRFSKFFNYGQEGAAKLDFSSAVEVSQKIDGSLIGLWFDGEKWRVSTSGNIDAEDAPLQFQTSSLKTYLDLFLSVFNETIFDKLNVNYTYMFELISPYNRVIVPYKKTALYLLAIRDNKTLLELGSAATDYVANQYNLNRPRMFLCNNISEATNAVSELSQECEHFEGFVLKDKNNNRIKLKSSAYMNLFFLKGDGVFSNRKILKIILDEEDDDIVANFPEYKDDFDRIRRGLCLFIEKQKISLEVLKPFFKQERKAFAEVVKNMGFNSIFFQAYTNNWIEMNDEEQADWLKKEIENISIDKLLSLIEKEGE